MLAGQKTKWDIAEIEVFALQIEKARETKLKEASIFMSRRDF
jgi:hypothetical protein